MEKSKNKEKKLKTFPLSTKKLDKLCKTDSGIVLRKDCHCKIKLRYEALPVHSKHFKKYVAEELNKRVLQYNADLHDMILRICNIRVLQPIEANRRRRLNVTCIADIYVFKPQCGSILLATVNKKSDSHLGCVMYEVFNVSIIKPDDLPYHRWAGRNIHVNDRIEFKVIKVDVSEIIPYIIGDLLIEDVPSSVHDEERDSVISTDCNSMGTSEDQYSELEDVMEAVKDMKSKKRKATDKTPPSVKKPAKRRRLM